MEEREQAQAERRKRQQWELEKEEEQNQSELRDERLRAQTASEEATLREMRLVTGAAEAERRTAEIELRVVQERLRRARQGDEADVYAVMDGPEVAMSYVPEGGGGGGRFGGGQGGGYRGAAYQEQGYRASDSAWERGGGRGQPWREGQYTRDARAGGRGGGGGGGRGGRGGKGAKGKTGGGVMYARTGQVPGSKEFTGCTPCWEEARVSRYGHSRAKCPQYWWKEWELWEGGRFFCEGCIKPSPEEVTAAKAAGLAPQQPGNMTNQEAMGDAGQEAV